MPITYSRGILLLLAVFAALLSLHLYSYKSQPRATHSERQPLGGVRVSLAVDDIEGPVRVPGLHRFSRFTCKMEGDRRGSNPRPPLEPQSDAARYSPSWCVR